MRILKLKSRKRGGEVAAPVTRYGAENKVDSERMSVNEKSIIHGEMRRGDEGAFIKADPEEVKSVVVRADQEEVKSVVVRDVVSDVFRAENGSFSPCDSIMKSGFCYGCERFTIDAPKTANEIGYCCRPAPEGSTYALEFKAISVKVLVRQCPDDARIMLLVKK